MAVQVLVVSPWLEQVEKSTPLAELVVPPVRVVLGLQVVIFLEILIALILLGELGSGASLETSFPSRVCRLSGSLYPSRPIEV